MKGESYRTHVLSSLDVHEIIRRVGLNNVMDALIDKIEHGFRNFDPEKTEIPIRSGFNYRQPHVGFGGMDAHS